MLEDHSVQPKDGTTEKVIHSLLLWICVVGSNARVRTCKMQNPAGSLCFVIFSSTRDVDANTTKYGDSYAFIFVCSPKIGKFLFQGIKPSN